MWKTKTEKCAKSVFHLSQDQYSILGGTKMLKIFFMSIEVLFMRTSTIKSNVIWFSKLSSPMWTSYPAANKTNGQLQMVCIGFFIRQKNNLRLAQHPTSDFLIAIWPLGFSPVF